MSNSATIENLATIQQDKDIKNEEVAIKVENLSKVYRLYDTPLDRLKESLHPFKKKYHREFYALRNVNFEVKRGETVGIIGKNGSGKSTLLKIITGVLTPTSGNITVNGKISALLELGTGFNPEFTGIENIYFSGTIMGYTKEEIDKKIDDIVAFADIGEFINQPVKTYSSGMYVRLAFSVATSIDPEILIIDEALSVGDMFFQAKSMNRMTKMIEKGCSLLFVSHDIGAVKSLCQKAIYFDNGRLKNIGKSEYIVNEYLKNMRTQLELKFEEINMNNNENVSSIKKLKDLKEFEYIICDRNNGYGSKQAIIKKYTVLNSYDEKGKEFDWGQNITIIAISTFFTEVKKYSIGFLIRDIYGLDVFGTNLNHEKIDIPTIKPDESLSVKFNFDLFLQPGIYTLTLAVSITNEQQEEIICDWHDNIFTFKINKASLSIPDTKVYIPTNIQIDLLK